MEVDGTSPPQNSVQCFDTKRIKFSQTGAFCKRYTTVIYMPWHIFGPNPPTSRFRSPPHSPETKQQAPAIREKSIYTELPAEFFGKPSI